MNIQLPLPPATHVESPSRDELPEHGYTIDALTSGLVSPYDFSKCANVSTLEVGITPITLGSEAFNYCPSYQEDLFLPAILEVK